MSGVDKFISTIQNFADWKDIPNMPHDGLNLLHARLRFALNKIGKEFKLPEYYVQTNVNSHLCGKTQLSAVFLNVMVIPGKLYNRILINKTHKNLPIANMKPSLSCDFHAFLSNPGILSFMLNELIGQEVRKKFARQHFP